ncbi:MAG: valine--tRNA ligase [Rhodospirillaceae bacterium]|nr:valine--tRNA ligase [Rhodospirillaceae bacterium]HAA93779.1 valine--tRNA ligase [Rhodospirillaceae bacterium]
MTSLEKNYQPEAVESKRYAEWEDGGAFGCGQVPDGDPFAIVIPPPNVTGSLHMGHALNNTLQDILIRHARMTGRDALWQPGMDHAGIATQMVVERQLAESGENRRDLGREKFLERVWQWKAESGGTITRQLRRLGASCDWSRERFTMDDGLSRAVLKVFVDLHEKGLIYRDKRLVNWDPKLETAISDLEVVQTETNGHLWYFRYPVDGEEGRHITVATTRPETMLGDTAVAVHPDDERYKDIVGKHCVLPLVGRRIVIVADEYADPEQGSGAVKITPAHDFNDFEVGRRHGLDMINVFDTRGRINDEAPEGYRGLDRFEARDKVVADIETAGLLEKIEDHAHTVPYGDRGGVPIEPYLTDQWFVNAAELAKPAIKAVEDGKTKFVPENWSKTYFEWMRNIQPWCISRQLWWGHQIPAWYGPDGEIFVALSEEDALAAAEKHYGAKTELTRDEDVLDTWFSSGLWAFSTLGWPDETPELKRYYPTDVLVTGFDIIFFWVARMMMLGIEFMGEVPFHTVYVHALVRDEKGQKMSKSKGNVIDPLDLIDQYGCDALRFTLASLAAPGRDIKLSSSRVEGSRNFATKIWNAARFCEMNECPFGAPFDPTDVSQTVNRWIISALVDCKEETARGLELYRFNDAAQTLYQFIWGTYCDWYLEFAKPLLDADDKDVQAETRATAAWVFEQILHLLHPFMPYLTEELFQRLVDADEAPLMLRRWPEFQESLTDEEAAHEIDWAIRLISGIRSVRSEMNVPAGAKIPGIIAGLHENSLSWLKEHEQLILRLARLDNIVVDSDAPKGAVQLVHDEANVFLPLADVIDLNAEQDRLKKEIAKADGEIVKLSKKLGNEQFLAKAPEAVVEEQRERLSAEEALKAKLTFALDRLASIQ